MLERRESFSGRRTNKGGAWQQQTIAREIMGEKKKKKGIEEKAVNIS